MNAILYLLSKELQARGYNVVGASKDSCASHRKFADKYELPFTLLADPSAEMIQAFGAWGEKVDTKAFFFGSIYAKGRENLIYMKKSIYDFTVLDMKKNPVKLDRYKGKVLLIVNTATGCGFTPQYKGLEDLYLLYKDLGLVVLGFPCNQFGHQAPGTEEEIKEFCDLNYGVTFPQFAKIDVNGDNESPLYKWLKKEKAGFLGTRSIKWNFTKFLVDRNGNVIKRFAPSDTPKDIEPVVLGLL